MRQQIQQPNQQGSAAAGWQKILDIGYLFHGLQLHWPAGGFSLADIYLIQYEINGVIYISLTGQELDDINVRDGVPTFDGSTFIIPFDLMNEKDQRMKELTAINTGVASPTNGKIINTHKLTVQLNPGADQAFFITADVEPATPDGPGLVRRFNRYIAPATNSAQGSTFSQFDFGNPNWAWWRRIWTKADSGLVTQQGLKATSGSLWGSPLAYVKAMNALAQAYGEQPLNYFSSVLDFGFAGGGYTAVPKVTPASAPTPANPNPQPVIKPDTGSNPYLPTIPLKGQTITNTCVNDTGGINNNFILEAMGEIES